MPDAARDLASLRALRGRLEAARAAGDDFADAWTAAVALLDHTWQPAVVATRDAWEAAYEGRHDASERLAALRGGADHDDHVGRAAPWSPY